MSNPLVQGQGNGVGVAVQQLFGALVRLVEGEGEDGFGFAIFVADAGVVSALTAFRRGDALVGQVV